MYQTPTTEDFHRNLVTILKRNRELGEAECARIEAEGARTGQTGNAIRSMGDRLTELYGAALDDAMRLISDYVARSHIAPKELAAQARPIIETLGAEFAARLGSGTRAQSASNLVRASLGREFNQRLDDALRDIEIGFIGGRNMVVPVKDADRRAVILQRFYDERLKGWRALPVDPNASQDDRIIAVHICEQLFEHRLIDWKGSATGRPEGMGRITATGIDVIEKTAPSPIAISIDKRSYTVTKSAGVVFGDGNVQGDIRLDYHAVSDAIDQSPGTDAEREEAKGLWRKVLGSPLLLSVLGSVFGPSSAG